MSVKKLFASAGLSFVLGFTSLNAQSNNNLSTSLVSSDSPTISQEYLKKAAEQKFINRLTLELSDRTAPSSLFTLKANPNDYDHAFRSALQSSARNAAKDLLVDTFLPKYGLSYAKPLVNSSAEHDFRFTRDPGSGIYLPRRDRVDLNVDVLDLSVGVSYRYNADTRFGAEVNYDGGRVVLSQRIIDSIYFRVGAEAGYNGKDSGGFAAFEKSFKNGTGGIFLGEKMELNGKHQLRFGYSKSW